VRAALARFPDLAGGLGSLAVYRAAGGQLELCREDVDGRAIASLYLAVRELTVISHLAEVAAVAVRGAGEEVLRPHELDLMLEPEHDDGSMGWYGRELERRARGDA
jgi:hypothetical protein